MLIMTITKKGTYLFLPIDPQLTEDQEYENSRRPIRDSMTFYWNAMPRNNGTESAGWHMWPFSGDV